LNLAFISSIHASCLCCCRSFTFSVDGKALSFLSQGDLISLFGNLLSNAVEAEMKLKDKDKAYIFLAVSSHSGMTSIHLENYFPEAVVFENGVPLTTKKDTRFHGYGGKSIRYIVKKYGGTYANDHEEGIFEVNILFPQR
jgi:sensor histidine kinase regulating citrate/malate metabolism